MHLKSDVINFFNIFFFGKNFFSLSEKKNLKKQKKIFFSILILIPNLKTRKNSNFLCLADVPKVCQVKPDDFKYLRMLGTGATAKVYLAQKLSGPDRGRLYAVKELSKYRVTKSPQSMVNAREEREVSFFLRRES